MSRKIGTKSMDKPPRLISQSWISAFRARAVLFKARIQRRLPISLDRRLGMAGRPEYIMSNITHMGPKADPGAEPLPPRVSRLRPPAPRFFLEGVPKLWTKNLKTGSR